MRGPYILSTLVVEKLVAVRIWIRVGDVAGKGGCGGQSLLRLRFLVGAWYVFVLDLRTSIQLPESCREII